MKYLYLDDSEKESEQQHMWTLIKAMFNGVINEILSIYEHNCTRVDKSDSNIGDLYSLSVMF